MFFKIKRINNNSIDYVLVNHKSLMDEKALAYTLQATFGAGCSLKKIHAWLKLQTSDITCTEFDWTEHESLAVKLYITIP